MKAKLFIFISISIIILFTNEIDTYSNEITLTENDIQQMHSIFEDVQKQLKLHGFICDTDEQCSYTIEEVTFSEKILKKLSPIKICLTFSAVYINQDYYNIETSVDDNGHMTCDFKIKSKEIIPDV